MQCASPAGCRAWPTAPGHGARPGRSASGAGSATEAAVEAMVTAMGEGPGAARVTDVWTEPADPAPVPAGFAIRA